VPSYKESNASKTRKTRSRPAVADEDRENSFVRWHITSFELWKTV